MSAPLLMAETACFDQALALTAHQRTQWAFTDETLSTADLPKSSIRKFKKYNKVNLRDRDSTRRFITEHLSEIEKMAQGLDVAANELWQIYRVHPSMPLLDLKEALNKVPRDNLSQLKSLFPDTWLKIITQVPDINVSELAEFIVRVNSSSEFFEISSDIFLTRLKKSGFSLKEYYERVDAYINRQSILKNSKQVFTGINNTFKETQGIIHQQFIQQVSLKPKLRFITDIINNSSLTHVQKGESLTKAFLALPINKLKEIFGAVIDTNRELLRLSKKKIIGTRQVNMEDFVNLIGINILVDNASMGGIHFMHHGFGRLATLGTDTFAFSIIEVILGTITVKDAAFLEAHPIILKRAKELAKSRSLTGKQRSVMQRMKNLWGGFKETRTGQAASALVGDGASLGAKTFAISLLPIAVANASQGMVGSVLVEQTFMTSALIGFFFATASNMRSQLLNKIIIPRLVKTSTLGSTAARRSMTMLTLSTINVTFGTYIWFLYRDVFEAITNDEDEDQEHPADHLPAN